ncbi:flavin reductase family protein [Kosmotoga olearia]|uniref:Flavin reductase domain protein FMN-binding n=1 Tax=Kosmotoga olearia (strain ATCC BAA-1733 / DSM 21960 / TBF 19.5.1) TaxID=521045 RepID=C5CI05_KOSOT|nr:flavin reductase family protein [Kosmotoga olearia]ACR79784.1 flavin reductase domain protein FMN-binding [Kosmotoga olearia TBF 19.5.1]
MDALGKLYNSTTIVTMNAGGKMNGIAVAWITRVSINPPMIAISIGKARYSHKLLNETDKFGVCIMEKSAKEIVVLFGTKSGRNCDKFAGIDYSLSKNDVPILPGTLAYIECQIKSKADAGDHTIFIGEVIDQKVFKDEAPMLYGEHRILL